MNVLIVIVLTITSMSPGEWFPISVFISCWFVYCCFGQNHLIFLKFLLNILYIKLTEISETEWCCFPNSVPNNDVVFLTVSNHLVRKFKVGFELLWALIYFHFTHSYDPYWNLRILPGTSFLGKFWTPIFTPHCD